MLLKLIKKRIYSPAFLLSIIRDFLDIRGPVRENAVHLHEAVQWILRAQAATGYGGVALGYSYEDGWIHSYPEVTGYIIPSLLSYAEYAEDDRVRKRALALAEWELKIQLDCGAFPGHTIHRNDLPAIFNTGQVIFGLLAAYHQTKQQNLLDGAIKAAHWLLSVQSEDGCWRNYDYRNEVHSYNTRTAWALVELSSETSCRKTRNAALQNLKWAIKQKYENGWIDFMAFSPDEYPYLHTIAYTIQGLLESGIRLNDESLIQTALHNSRVLLKLIRSNGSMAGEFDRDWKPKARYSCLTGIAQMAVVWYRAFMITGEENFKLGAVRAAKYLKSLQNCTIQNPNIRGALKGSHPIWGRYLFGTYPSWSVKFFIDCLLLEEAVLNDRKMVVSCW
ncbi:MAG: hypothetical protein JXR49_05340 [Acidobacteria bacterium]|nr:hypothetical protein [Acidobacteriota bacterium]